MSARREPSTLTHACAHKGHRCYRCRRPIALGAEMITAYDGVNAITYHVECPAYPPANLAAAALFAELLKETR